MEVEKPMKTAVLPNCTDWHGVSYLVREPCEYDFSLEGGIKEIRALAQKGSILNEDLAGF